MNFLKRTVTAVLFGAVMLFAIQKGGWLFFGLFALITVLTAGEFSGLAARYRNAETSMVLTAITSLAFYFGMAAIISGHKACLSLSPFMLTIIIVIVRELYARHESPMASIAYTVFPVIYIALPMALMIALGYNYGNQDHAYSPAIPLMLFLCIWANDVGAYCTGCTIGRHKLFERISPKKTWEGSTGGAVLAIAAACLLAHFATSLYSSRPMWVWAGMAVVIVVAGTFGDLAESLMKREMGIKDSGNILPGHGGMLDRFDSTLLAVPATIIWLSLVSL